MKLYEICFSPTGGTKRVADCLADAQADQVTVVDLTDAETDFHKNGSAAAGYCGSCSALLRRAGTGGSS